MARLDRTEKMTAWSQLLIKCRFTYEAQTNDEQITAESSCEIKTNLGASQISAHLKLKYNPWRKHFSASHHFFYYRYVGHSQLKIPARLGGDWWLLSHFFRVWTTHIYQENLLWWIDLLIPVSLHPIQLQSMETWWMYLLLVSTPWLSSFTMGRRGKCMVYFIVVFWHIFQKKRKKMKENSTYQGSNWQSSLTTH